jgi:hypothetical protein
MIQHLDSKEKEEVKPLARIVAQAFLRSELENVETKIRRRNAYLERWYPDVDDTPSGEAELLAVYQQQEATIEELMRASEEDLFVELLRRRRQRAEERLLQSASRDVASEASRSAGWRVKTEVEILRDLQIKWLNWLKA